MGRKLPIFYSALMLTGVNLLLRMVGTSFQVYLSGRIGAAGIGLLQLTLSVGSLASVAGIAGVRTAAMYLTAEEIGKGREGNIRRILSACFLYSILCSCAVAAGLAAAAPWLAEHWIGDTGIIPALRLYAAFLPVICLCAVMTGCYTGAGKIGTLAVVEVGEQLCTITIIMTVLKLWAGHDPGRACLSVILGNSLGAVLTLVCLLILYRGKSEPVSGSSDAIPRLLRAAVPLALADIVRSGIGTVENLMVPKRLALFPGEKTPLAAFGTVSGMVFPVMMFPACILFGLAELLIPEMARCSAAGQQERISYLVRRSLRIAMLYGLGFGGLIFLAAEPLCIRLYKSPEAGFWLRSYAVMIPILYCDAITDAISKGLGQQKICVRYNILTSAMDVAFLWYLLPRFGMTGYFLSFLITHVLNFLLSLRLLCRVTGFSVPLHLPAMGTAGCLTAVWLASAVSSPAVRIPAFLPLLGSLFYLTGVISGEDLRWAAGIIRGRAAGYS